MIDSITFAKYIIAYAKKESISVNITKVQKLLYICYGSYLFLKGNRLLTEQPVALPYGPVFSKTLDYLNSKENFDEFTIDKYDVFNDEIKKVVKIVMDFFGKYNANTLVNWTHRDGSAWSRIVKEKGLLNKADGWVKWSITIPDEYIKDEFETIIKQKE